MKKLLITSFLATAIIGGIDCAAFGQTVPPAHVAPAPAQPVAAATANAASHNPMAALPADRQHFILTGLSQNTDKRRVISDKINAARLEVRNSLIAPKFDKTTYLVKAKKLQELIAEEQKITADNIVVLAPKLSLAERTALADMVARVAPPHPAPAGGLPSTAPVHPAAKALPSTAPVNATGAR